LSLLDHHRTVSRLEDVIIFVDLSKTLAIALFPLLHRTRS